MPKYPDAAGAILVHRQTGKVLLQHRTEDAPEKPGMWSFFGGAVEVGESPSDTAARELREELCLFLTPHLVLFGTEVIRDADAVIRTRYFFIGHTDYDELWLRKYQQEGQGLGFFDEEESNALHMDEQDRLVLLMYFDSVRESGKSRRVS